MLQTFKVRIIALGFSWLFAGVAVGQTTFGKSNSDASGPQTAMPAPVSKGQADVPGGSSRNGVITPPPTTSAGMPTIKPRTPGRMPVITPPGTGNNQSSVQPK
jgi:hypothetical protein